MAERAADYLACGGLVRHVSELEKADSCNAGSEILIVLHALSSTGFTQ